MFTDQLLDHFRNPRHVGELPPPAVTIEASNPACGDILRLSARIEAGRIVEVAYRVRGCTASIAAGSALAEWLTGSTTETSLPSLSAGTVEDLLGGLPAESKHAAVLCADAVKILRGRITSPR